MSTVASQITGISIVCSAVCQGADQRKQQNLASLTFVRGTSAVCVRNLTHVGFTQCIMHAYVSCTIPSHYNDVMMGAIASQLTGVSIVCSAVCQGADQRKHQSSASLTYVRGTSGDRWIPSQRDSNAENVSIWWRHHVLPDQIKDDDILHSLYSVWVRNITHLAFSQCIMEGVHNLYFCGNFINNERARYWMTREAGSRWVNKVRWCDNIGDYGDRDK